MKELQHEVVRWANEVFPDRDLTNALTKLVLEEVPELWRDLRDTGSLDPLELADVAILLLDIAYLADIDLDSAVRDKLEVNRQRKWFVRDGIMVHEHEHEDK